MPTTKITKEYLERALELLDTITIKADEGNFKSGNRFFNQLKGYLEGGIEMLRGEEEGNK